LMYDHQTRSLWSHYWPSRERRFPGETVASVSQHAKNCPETKVLSVANNTDSPGQHRENEVQDRYQQYDQSSSAGVSQTQYTDSRLKNKEQVVGIRINEDYRAYPFLLSKKNQLSMMSSTKPLFWFSITKTQG